MRIREYMSGNICRRGAYAGIVAAIEDAAAKMEAANEALLQPAPGEPEDAVRAFASTGSGARYVAGGTTLYDLMKLNIEQPSHLV